MSIAAPNYDKLPSRQAEKRDRERQLEEAQERAPVEALSGRGRKDVAQPMAVCHRKRRAVNADLLCRPCLNKRLMRAERSDLSPEQALERVQTQGVEKIADKVRAFMQANQPEYARLHLEATRVAAAKGDAKPAEWALTNIRTGDNPIVSPPKDGGGGGGIKVMIGVQIGGLPPGVQTQAITIPAEAVVTEGVPSDTE